MLILSIFLVALGVGAAIGMIHWLERKPWSQSLPESISAMVYLLPERGGWRWVWTIWLVFVDVLTFAPVIEILDPRGLGILGFLPMAMLGFVAVWPLFDIEHRKWHYILAIAAGFISQIDVWLICPWWLFGWFVLPLAAYSCRKQEWVDGKGVLISEVICYVAVIGSEITYILSN